MDGWTIVEYFLNRRGIYFDDRNRRLLMGVGLATIIAITLAL
jgi:hypothetical protein